MRRRVSYLALGVVLVTGTSNGRNRIGQLFEGAMARVGLVVTDSSFLMMSRVPEASRQKRRCRATAGQLCVAFAIIDHTGARAMQPSRHSAGGSVRRQGWLSESGRDRDGVGVRNNVRARNAWRIFARRDGGRRVRGQRHFLADIKRREV